MRSFLTKCIGFVLPHFNILQCERREPDGSVWSKTNKGDQIWWLETNSYGNMIFSFDRKERFDMWTDNPDKLTPEQKEIFDKENPDFAEE